MKNQSNRRKAKQKEKPFGPIEVKTVDSEEWLSLNKIEAHVYNTIKTFYRGDERSFKAPFETLKRRTRIKHGHTLDKAIQNLEMKGWLKVTRYAKHGKKKGLRVKANDYALTFKYDFRRY